MAIRYFVEINLVNDAFAENPGLEVARILRGLADRVDGYRFDNAPTRFPVSDINGNRCGTHGYDGETDEVES